MDLIQIKISPDNAVIKYVKIIRKFDPSLSINTIKQCIEKNDFVVEFDLEYYDMIEEIQGIDRKEVFRNMIDELLKAGADIAIYQDGKLSSLELLDNWLNTIEQIRIDVDEDIDRETE